MLGLTFKENVPDLRNSKVVDVVRRARKARRRGAVHDPLADPAEARHEYGIELSPGRPCRAGDALSSPFRTRPVA